MNSKINYTIHLFIYLQYLGQIHRPVKLKRMRRESREEEENKKQKVRRREH